MPLTDGGTLPSDLASDLDLLVVVDNSNSMTTTQTGLMAQLERLLQLLATPPCASAANPTAHPCNAGDPADRPVFPAARSVPVGVLSSDLGTPGSSVLGCANNDLGDDGLLNPIRYGQALRQHLPFTAPPGSRPADCADRGQFPAFVTFDSTRAGELGYVVGFAHDFRCNAGLYIGGCGIEQQLDAAWPALIWHDASDSPGNADPNAGFVRPGALLAIVVLSDEDDGSVRHCRFARDTPCTSATDVFSTASTRWSSANLNLRFYTPRPGTAQDST